MTFQKGKLKTGGRAIGTPNTINRELRERLKALLEEQFEQVVADLKSLEPKLRVEAWLKMAEFVLPKLQRTEVDAALTLPDADNRPITVLQIAFRPPAEHD